MQDVVFMAEKTARPSGRETRENAKGHLPVGEIVKR
jgi:hypothetical protein